MIDGDSYANIRSLRIVAVILPRFSLAIAAGGRSALALRLALLPAPAKSLRLAAEQLGPPAPPAEALFDDEEFRRAGRLSEAIGQLRALAGPQAALRVLLADPQSRIPERRAVLTPYER